jgi:hypothetical protein
VTTETSAAYSLVKKHFPEAFLKKSVTFNGKCEEYIIFDPESNTFLGPTAFAADSAWHYAAERLRKTEDL